MTKNKTEYTPTEALECLDGISKNALYDDMNNGRITYENKQWGNKKRRYIAGAELARFYDSKFRPQRLDGTPQVNETKQPQTQSNETKTTFETKFLEQKVEFMNERMKDRESQLHEARDREKNLLGKIDKAQGTIEQQTLLIQDMRQHAATQPMENPKDVPKLPLTWPMVIMIALFYGASLILFGLVTQPR